MGICYNKDDIKLKNLLKIINDNTYIIVNNEINKKVLYVGKVKNLNDELDAVENIRVDKLHISMYKSKIYLNIKV